MVDVPIELFLGFGFMMSAFAIAGIAKRIPILIFVGGVFMLTMFILPDVLIMGFASTDSTPELEVYDVTSHTGAMTVNSLTRTIVAEYPSVSSSPLWHSTFDCISIPMAKQGTLNTPTNVIIGTFDANGNLVKEFGQLNDNALTTAYVYFTFCLPEPYTLTDNERIGVQYAVLDAVNQALVRVDGNNPFDGTNTILQTFATPSWSSTTTQDLTMTLTLQGADGSIVNAEYEYTEMVKVVFGLFGAILLPIGFLLYRETG